METVIKLQAKWLADQFDGEGNILFYISFSGISKDVVIPVEECKPTAKIIALTESSKSPLGKIAYVCFQTHTEELI